MRSHSWSANICGRKQWTFFKPGDEVLLQDRYGNLAFDLRSKELADSSKYPRAEEGLTMHRIEVIQNPGEVIFVPSQWHHQVVNLEDTISINHNWLCGCNVDLCWRYIQTQLVEVKSEIADCEDMDEWPQQCQLILKASSGIDYAEFFKFMHIIGERRLELLEALLKPEATREDEDEAVGSNIGSLKCNECAGNSNVSHEIVRPRRELQTKDEHCNKEFLDGCCKEEQAYTVGADVIFLEHMNNPKDDSVKVQQNIACNKQCNKVCDVEVKSNTLEDEICKKVGKTNVSNSSVADRGLQPAEHHATCQTAQKQSQDATNVIRLDLRGATHGEVQAVTSSGDKNFKQSENTCNETDMVQVERNCLENTIGYCRHLWFDMVQVASIVQDMLDDRDFQQLDTSSWDIQPSQWKLTLDEKIAYYENLLDFDLLS